MRPKWVRPSKMRSLELTGSYNKMCHATFAKSKFELPEKIYPPETLHLGVQHRKKGYEKIMKSIYICMICMYL